MGKASNLTARPCWELHDLERSQGRVCQMKGQLVQRPRDSRNKMNRISRRKWGETERGKEVRRETETDTETRRQERVWEIQKKSEMGADTLRRNMARDQGGRGGKERIREEKSGVGAPRGIRAQLIRARRGSPSTPPFCWMTRAGVKAQVRGRTKRR